MNVACKLLIGGLGCISQILKVHFWVYCKMYFSDIFICIPLISTIVVWVEAKVPAAVSLLPPNWRSRGADFCPCNHHYWSSQSLLLWWLLPITTTTTGLPNHYCYDYYLTLPTGLSSILNHYHCYYFYYCTPTTGLLSIPNHRFAQLKEKTNIPVTDTWPTL